MFKRKWSALPADVIYPNDLKELGYFINKDDEVRSIENEDNYFKFFINRNMRICDRQRFAMNHALEAEIHKRLEDLGLHKLFLPIGTDIDTQPNVPIFVGADIAKKSRVVVIFGETCQSLGVLAHRVVGGKGGINKGSLVSIVQALTEQQSSLTDPSAPGVIIANMGELLWWPEGKMALTRSAFQDAPMRSAAHDGNDIVDKLHRIPDNENPKAHVRYMFEHVLPTILNKNARLDVIGIGDGADIVASYLAVDEVWDSVVDRIQCLALVSCQFDSESIQCDGFRAFLRDRARAYVLSEEPLGTVLSGPDGNPFTTLFTSLGCPVFSAGEAKHFETLFIASHTEVLDWLQVVALAPAPYKNPEFTVTFADPVHEPDCWGADWATKDAAPEEVTQEVDEEVVEQDVEQSSALRE